MGKMENDTPAKYSNLAIANAISMLRGAPFYGDFETDWVQKFELEFQNISGHPHNIAVNSGTSALHAALAGFDIKQGDEVIMPALSVVMNAYAALALGATPVFADVNRETWNIDLDSIKKVYTSKTKAIITVSWFGVPVDLDPIIEFAKSKNIFVLEDAAESLGATYKGRPNGLIADAVAYSFENKKHLTTGGEGGLIATSNSEIAIKARKFSGLGYKHLSENAGRTSLASSVFQRPDYKRYDTVSLNYRMSPLSAAVGSGQLEHINAIIELRQKNGLQLVELITSHSDFIGQKLTADSSHAYYSAAVKYIGDKKWKDIYDLVIEFGGDGFYGNVLNPYLEPVFLDTKTYLQNWSVGLCPNAEELQPRIMAIKTDFRDSRDLNRNLIAWEKMLDKI